MLDRLYVHPIEALVMYICLLIQLETLYHLLKYCVQYTTVSRSKVGCELVIKGVPIQDIIGYAL